MTYNGGQTGNRLQPAAGLQEFGVRYILSSSSKSSHASCRENFIPASPYFRGIADTFHYLGPGQMAQR